MRPIELRESHETPLAFDLFLVGVAVFGVSVAYLCFTAGGWWTVLGVAALVGEALLVHGSFIEPRRITVAHHREALVEDPQAWVRITFCSDMHAGDFKPASWFAKVARTVQGLRPDIAVLGGDVVVDASRPIGDLAAFKDVVAKLGKVYVMGNHDLVDRPQDIRKAIEGWGYACIENKTVRFEKDGRHFDLSGIADPWFGDPRPVPRASRKVPHVTVSHEPDMLMDMVAGDTDLMLAGHTHAGQVRLPLVGALWPIPAKLGRAVDQGRKVVNGILVIVTNGLGESDGRLRLFAPPQIVCVDIGI